MWYYFTILLFLLFFDQITTALENMKLFFKNIQN